MLQRNKPVDHNLVRKIQEAVGAVLGFPTRMTMIDCDFRLVFLDLCGWHLYFTS